MISIFITKITKRINQITTQIMKTATAQISTKATTRKRKFKSSLLLITPQLNSMMPSKGLNKIPKKKFSGI